MRRRRATGGPAEKAFAGLVGLELRPRRLRDAANLWAALEAKHGADGRDGGWGHPDVAPTGADLDDPLGYVERFGTLRERRPRRRPRPAAQPRARPTAAGLVRRGRTVTAPSTDVPTAYLALRADARARAGRRGTPPTPSRNACERELLGALCRAPGRDVGSRAHRRTSRRARWCSTPRSTRCCSPCTRRPGCGCSSAATSSRATSRCSRRRPARPARSPGSPRSSCTRSWSTSTGTRLLAAGFGRCSEHLDLRYAGVARDEAAYAVSERVARRRLVAGGRAARGQRRDEIASAGRRGAAGAWAAAEPVGRSVAGTEVQRGLAQLVRCRSRRRTGRARPSRPRPRGSRGRARAAGSPRAAPRSPGRGRARAGGPARGGSRSRGRSPACP